MTSFSLEDALRASAAVMSRPDEFTTYILETLLPGVHFNVDDDGLGLPKPTLSPQLFTAAGPCLLDGAHVDYIIPGYDQQGWGYDNAPMKILAEGSKAHPSGEDEQCSKVDDISRQIFHSHCLEFLVKNGPDFLMKNLQGKESIGSMLLNMAENVKVLTPANDPLPWDILNMSFWKNSLWELIKEMKTVEEKCPSLICNSGVYVLTSSPYAAFLRALAAEINADGRS